MAINKRYEERLTREIHEYLKTYGPTSARAITEDLNPRYKGQLTTMSVVTILKREKGHGRMREVAFLDKKMIIWGTNMGNDET